MKRTVADLDPLDRELLNRLQDGIPVEERPFAALAEELQISEDELLARVQSMLDEGVLSRFGPMYRADALGGAFILAAMAVPAERLDDVAEFLDTIPEVAHNYEREHDLNMWFVLASDRLEALSEVTKRIERVTGLHVLMFPKKQEFYVDLRFKV